ncbi:MAG: YfhO family protein [Lachnospiraceae bacterium]|nr:YfhO family protein [Lachnospiraceae bacterium]
MGNKRKELAVCLLAFLIPAAMMFTVYAFLGMAPWGDKTVLISDMAEQYVEFFCALKNGELFFSWSKALGTSYVGVFSYYVSSPLSVLTLFFPNEEMPLGLMLLTVLKIGLAGTSFAWFSVKRYPGSGLSSLLCAVCYALMSYNAAYSLCIMWLDGVIWLPLILLALERILDGKGSGPFVAALTVCFFSTWYISYMVGAFCLLYFIARVVMCKPAWKALFKQIGRFLSGAVCALCLTAWLWLPTFLAMFAGKFSGGNIDYDGLFTAGPMELLGRLWSGKYTSITQVALPYLFCGTAAFVLAILFFFQHRPLRERLAWLGLGLALGASLLLSPLDKLWHLMQKPNWFPYRYTFVFSFFLLILANQALTRVMGAVRNRIGFLPAKVAVILLLAVTVAELGMNTHGILTGLDGQFRYRSYQVYRNYYAANEELVAAAEADTNEAFYRIGATEDLGHNSPLSFGYAGITHYSSLYNYNVNRLTRRLGFAQSWMWCAYYGSTPVTDAILDVKYIISQGEQPYETVARSGSYTLYRNPDTLPPAFFSAGTEVLTLSETATPFERQNDLLSALVGEAVTAFVPVYTEIGDTENENTENETTFTFTGQGRPIYADLSAGGLTQVLINGEILLSMGRSEAASVHYLGTPAAGETWTVTVRHNGSWIAPDLFIWELNRTALENAVNAVDMAQIFSVKKNGTVRLSVKAESSGMLLTTIPAEDGWMIYVDGQQAECSSWLDTFLAVPLTAGTHTVVFRYVAPGLIPGIALSGITAMVLIVAAYRKKKYRNNMDT